MVPRFLVPDLGGAALVRLPDDEAHHLARVLRLRPGAAVAVFDGRGREMTATVEAVTRDGVTVRTVAPAAAAGEPRVAITFAPALLRRDAMDAVVRDATMMGVRRIAPVVGARSQTSVAAVRRGRSHERWRRIAVASAKQCGRAVVPDVDPPVEFERWLDSTPAACRLILAEPGATRERGTTLGDLRGRPVPGAAALLAGPEGGWTRAELDAALERGWMPLGLGSRTLRADAVPLVALAALMAVWDEL